MNNMTWLDLYNFLYNQANDVNRKCPINWQDPVMIHDANTGDEINCDTWIVCNDDGRDRLVLATNIASIFTERN